jgi:predicted alpha-1,2-mannosidase
MPGTFIDCVIAEAAVRKIGSREVLEKGPEGMLHHANIKSDIGHHGRRGIEHYLKHGYVPYTSGIESVNLTLDFAYGDWCIATVARALGKTDIYNEYIARAKNYRHLFDKSVNFMRAKDEKGELLTDFDPYKWGGAYTEASAWQSTLAVQHDIEGLCELFGGRDSLIEYLDKLFGAPAHFRVNSYGAEIHEMSEMATVNFGQCAISNQPSFHIPYMYAYLGENEKSEHWIRRICTELFKPTPDGYPGDEDNGTMSAWYILSCLGLYRMCPGKDEWIKIKPLVRNAKILGKKLK